MSRIGSLIIKSREVVIVKSETGYKLASTTIERSIDTVSDPKTEGGGWNSLGWLRRD